MQTDPRCKRLNELSDQYHTLFRQLTEKYLAELCGAHKLPEPLCVGDYMLLHQLSESGEGPVSMADISRKMKINPSTATRRVNRLVNNGLVVKIAAKYDDRRYDLRMTAKGTKITEEMGERLYQAVLKTYEPITETELQAVYHYLETCIEQLDQLVSA